MMIDLGYILHLLSIDPSNDSFNFVYLLKIIFPDIHHIRHVEGAKIRVSCMLDKICSHDMC